MENWINAIREANKSCIIESGNKKVLYKFADGRELAEEYNMDTLVVTRRAWKKKQSLTGKIEWEIEIGDQSLPTNVFEFGDIREASTEPMVSTRITKKCFEWRIRNLPYPVETYSVEADNEQRCITIRTTNKKFFKRLTIPDLNRLQLPIEQNNISISHKYNTLIISYKKPAEALICEKLVLEEIAKINVQQENPFECTPS